MSRTQRYSAKLPEMKKTSSPEFSNSGPVNLWRITDSVARFDENARRRLESMNKKLRDMEKQMEAFEADIRKVQHNASSASMTDFSY